MKTRSPEQSIVVHETQWTQPWSRVRSQVDVIHLVRSTGAIVSNLHLHSVKSCPEKSRPIKYGGQMHGVMIAIEYSYKLDRKNYFTLWCELGRLLLRQSQLSPNLLHFVNPEVSEAITLCKHWGQTLSFRLYLASVYSSYKFVSITS